MPSKKHSKKHNKRSRRARGRETDELERAERGEVVHSKPKTPPPHVQFHRVSPKLKTNPFATSILPPPPGFDPVKIEENALRFAESAMDKPTTRKSELARISTPDFFDYPPPDEREELRRAASKELKEAEAKALAETALVNAEEEAAARVVSLRLDVPKSKRSFLYPFGFGKKSKKSKKRHNKSRKGKKHSTRRK